MPNEGETKKFCVYDLPPDEYAACVQESNEWFLKDCRRSLARVHLDHDQAIIVVGSDGKKEAESQSATEFVLLNLRSSPPFNMSAIKKALSPANIKSRPNFRSGFEIRKVDGSGLLSYYDDDPGKVFPDRILNATLVTGNPFTYLEARRRLVDEISGIGYESKRIRDKMADQLRQHKKAMQTGVWWGKTIFNTETSTQFYDESDPVGTFGFKHSHLRAVQVGLNLFTARLVNRGRLNSPDVAVNLPQSTSDKFDYFKKLNLIDSKTAEETQGAYLWFLREYHRVQRLYRDNGRAVSLMYRREDFQKYSDIITEFTSRLPSLIS